MTARIDMTGCRFGRLVVEQMSHQGKRYEIHWIALCDCGKRTIVTTHRLRSGNTRSCGCLFRSVVAARNRTRVTKYAVTHGHARTGQLTPTYKAWMAMRMRCTQSAHKEYHRYGGRGITVCERWAIFANFLEDMGERPQGREIDRINNDGNYEPANCRWATHKEQMRNMSRNRILTLDGRSQTLADWADEAQLNYGTLRTRLRLGWPLRRALSEPVMFNVRWHGKTAA